MSDDTETVPDPFDMSEDELNAYTPEDTMVPESEEDSTEEEEVTEETTEAEPEEAEATETGDEPEDEQVEEEEETPSEDEPEAELDYKAKYEELMAPFKANGKEITTDTIEEVIKLKSMGANYTKKMVAMKPHMKVIKMLEKNNLLDEGQLNYLIDLSNKDPKAIAKLVKESGIDPLDINQDESEKYTPKNHTISEKEFKLDEVLAQIESTPTGSRTIDILGNKWDDSSTDKLTSNPKKIADINEHMSNGIFDMISAEIDKQQMFGGLDGLSNLEAYEKVGSELYARGDFSTKSTPTSRSKPKVKQSEAVRKLKKRAASTTKTTPKKKPSNKKVNYFDLSDEELQKLPTNY